MPSMLIASACRSRRAFVLSGLRCRHTYPACSGGDFHRQVAADGSFFERPDDSNLPSDGKKESDVGSRNEDVSQNDSAKNTERETKEPEKIPDSQWYPGIVVYAITNVGFLKIFEFSVDVVDTRVTLAALAVYYAVAFLLRYLLRRVFKVDDKFPQFFWEGFPQRYRK